METEKKSFARGWSMVACWFIAWGVLNFVTNQITSIYRTAFSELRGFDVTFILDVNAYAAVIVSFLVLVLPKVLSKCGAKFLMVLGLLGAGITMIITSFATNQLLFAILMGLQSLWGVLYATIGSMVMVSRWFPRKKGSIMGLITGASILSAGIMLPIFSAINTRRGIQVAMITFGIVIIIYALICIIWLKETPEECGLMPDNKPMTDEERMQLAASRHVESDWSYRQLLKSKPIWFISLGWGFGLMGIGALSQVAFGYLSSLGVDYEAIILTMTVGGYLTVAGSWGSGFVDQRIGPRKTGVFVMLFITIAFALAAFWPSAPAAVGIACMLTIFCFAGATNNLGSSQLLGIYGPRSFGTVTILSSLLMTLRNIGTWITARSLSFTGSYEAGFAVIAVLLIIGTFLIWFGGEKFIPAPINKK